MGNMNDRGIPPQWQPYFDAKQIEGYRELGRKAQIEWTRARRVVIGGGTTDEAVQAVAEALGIPPRKVWELRGQPVPAPFVLPDQAGHLNRRERDAILAIVNALIESKGIESLDKPQRAPTDDPIGDEIIRSATEVDNGDDRTNEAG